MLKMYLISDNIDTQTGMRLAGVEGVVVHTPEDGKAAMEKVLDDKQIGILIVTEKVAGMLREYVDELKLSLSIPLLVEIPDRHGTGRAPDSITKYVREAIGVKI